MNKHHALQLIFFFIYILIITSLMIWHGIGITPDRYFIVLLAGAFLIGHSKYFIHDFAPFILILIGYEFLRGFADNLNPTINFVESINITKWIFDGHIPTVELQRRFYTPGFLHWYDYASTILYFLHFATPLIFAFILWFYNRKHFREFMLGLVVLSYMAAIVYVYYPTAPPWLASKYGYLPKVIKIFNVTLKSFPERLHIPTIYQATGVNLVAAVPSMHAGYSFLTFLFALRFFGLWGFLLLPYCLAMWFSIVYLGEHYFIDIVAGVLLSLIAFGLAKVFMEKYSKFLDRL